ncbi:hypothetical protein RhiirA4_469330 [Rhizophagus irregularis]|uniref:Uncharacterized protein n=1 Tax=Rhizophagus irregularis TaxID=588596 RepID=A0A2I1GZC2_9GLOM|nr:hypothetical protein RhiirA4_469330 [Rhizophagus irregularis]
MAEENEFYSKLCVAEIFRGAVDEKSEEEIDLLGGDKFSHNLATILARDREVVAINLRVLSDGYLKPDVVIQPILPWNGIVKKFLDHEKEYEGFMEVFLKDPMIGYRLERMYGGVDVELNCV